VVHHSDIDGGVGADRQAGGRLVEVGLLDLLALDVTDDVCIGKGDLLDFLAGCVAGDLDVATLDRYEARLRQLASEIASASGTRFTVSKAVDSQPAMSDSRMMDWVDQTAAALGLSSQRMRSGAGHDAQEVAHIAPMAMIFVPSVGGISHSPREFTKADDVASGVDVLLNAVMRADRE